jgi:hypothetical protein
MMVHHCQVFLSGLFDDDGGSNVLPPNSILGLPSFGSVNRVVTCPHVLSFWEDGQSYARLNLAAVAASAYLGSLMDSGANICLTGKIGILFDVVTIPPLPISVALQGEMTTDDCCTACGKIPLQLDDGSIYWQDCYYSKNAVEMIILPQAIVDSSDVF